MVARQALRLLMKLMVVLCFVAVLPAEEG